MREDQDFNISAMQPMQYNSLAINFPTEADLKRTKAIPREHPEPLKKTVSKAQVERGSMTVSRIPKEVTNEAFL